MPARAGCESRTRRSTATGPKVASYPNPATKRWLPAGVQAMERRGFEPRVARASNGCPPTGLSLQGIRRAEPRVGFEPTGACSASRCVGHSATAAMRTPGDGLEPSTARVTARYPHHGGTSRHDSDSSEGPDGIRTRYLAVKSRLPVLIGPGPACTDPDSNRGC